MCCLQQATEYASRQVPGLLKVRYKDFMRHYEYDPGFSCYCSNTPDGTGFSVLPLEEWRTEEPAYRCRACGIIGPQSYFEGDMITMVLDYLVSQEPISFKQSIPYHEIISYLEPGTP